MPKSTAFVLLSSLLFCSAAAADNWPHWRGPFGTGAAPNASPPTEWTTTKNIKWKVEDPGTGLSSPIIWENRVYITTAVAAEPAGKRDIPALEFKTLCFDRGSGNLLWEKVATVAKPHQGTHSTNGFASASPCTDGEHVYAHFGSRGLYCYTLDGELKWKRDDFGKMDTLNSFGEGSSPTLEGDMILVPWDHRGPSALYALNKRTGDRIWKVDRDEPTAWGTPLVVEYAGRKQVIMNGQNAARSYDLETGRELWRCGGQTRRPIATPVPGNGVVYIGSGFQGAFLGAFKLDGEGDIDGSDKVLWTINRDTPDVASPLLSSGRLYFHKGKSGQLSCVDAATGKPHYLARRISGIDSVYSSPVAAGGHIYLTSRSGTTVVIKDSDELSIVATNLIDETTGATPAAVGNELFLRGEKHLYCISSAAESN